ncbi:Uncharacterised protein [Enterobacter hormaechei]|nr:Uncharacterised protein [Enterobacter hormaechei]
MVKTVVREHSRSSSAITDSNCEVIMTNAYLKHQAKGA